MIQKLNKKTDLFENSNLNNDARSVQMESFTMGSFKINQRYCLNIEMQIIIR